MALAVAASTAVSTVVLCALQRPRFAEAEYGAWVLFSLGSH